MSSAGCGSGTRFSSELMTNNRLLSLYDCSVHLISFGSADIDQLTCHTASCRPHPHACFSCNGTIGVLLSERGPSPLITCCCCFYICHSWYSAHMGIVLRNTTSPNQFIYRVSLPWLSLNTYSPAYINHSLLQLHFCCACIIWKYKLIFRSVLLDTNLYEVANHIAGAKQCRQ